MNRFSAHKLITSLVTLMSAVTMSSVSAETLKDFTFKVEPFKVLKIQDNVNVIYHCDLEKAGTVSYRATQEFDDAFIFTNSGNTLRIQVTTEDVDKPGLPTIHVYSDHLSKIDNYSDFNVTVEDPCEGQQFTASLMGNGTINIKGINTAKLCAKVTAGNGTITISGVAEKADFRMTGAGHIEAEDLKVKDVSCKIFGGGSIVCGPERNLKSMGIGSTKIKYHGSPKIKHSGGGKLISLDKDAEQ